MGGLGVKAIITRVETVRKGDVFQEVKFGEPMDWVLRVSFQSVEGDVETGEVVRGWEVFNLSRHPDSKLSRFIGVYGAPVRGLIVDIDFVGGFWRIKL